MARACITESKVAACCQAPDFCGSPSASCAVAATSIASPADATLERRSRRALKRSCKVVGHEPFITWCAMGGDCRTRCALVRNTTNDSRKFYQEPSPDWNYTIAVLL